MVLYVASTASKANTYVLASGVNALALDAGVPWRNVVTMLPPGMKLDGCLVTHEHMDHARAVDEYMARGRRIAASAGTLRALGFQTAHTSQVTITEPRSEKTFGPSLILQIETQNDEEEQL